MVELTQFPRKLAGHLACSILNLLPSRPELRSNRRFHEIHRGERCFILGSGGSVLGHDLRAISTEVVITQNNFHRHPQFQHISPQYHCVVPQYQPPGFYQDWITWYKSMEDAMPNETIVFVGLNAAELLSQNRIFEGRRHYIQQGLDPLFMRQAKFDISKYIMNVPTVLTQCLSVALYMGFTKIYLAGFDLDQYCHGGEQNYGRFYGTSPITANAAERRLDEDAEWWGDHWFQFWVMWRQFVLLREAALRAGSEIVNLAPGGLLNCFPRDSYERVLHGDGARR